MGAKLVAIALTEKEAKLLEEIARRKGYNDIGEAVIEALKLFLYRRNPSTSLQASYLSRRVAHKPGTSYP